MLYAKKIRAVLLASVGILVVATCGALSTDKLVRIRACKTSMQRVTSLPAPPVRSGSLTTEPSSSSSSSTGLCFTLDDYMQLPAAQYACVPMPLDSSLTRIRGTADEFRLLVPPMHFKVPGVQGVHVRPVVMARVTVEPNHVVIYSDSCIIDGSPVIERLRLNDFFDFSVRICLTWGNRGEAEEEEEESFITAVSEIQLNVDPPGPFAFVPRRITEAVGNQVMSFSLGALQKDFMKSLGKDFERWVSDDKYRSDREKLGSELVTEREWMRDMNESLLAYLEN